MGIQHAGDRMGIRTTIFLSFGFSWHFSPEFC
jgi:hypothetical protein